jgi:hypothetical protein
MTCTLAGSTAGYTDRTSARMPSDTAMTAAAPSIATFSAHDDSA